jgi:hypothetical protein
MRIIVVHNNDSQGAHTSARLSKLRQAGATLVAAGFTPHGGVDESFNQTTLNAVAGAPPGGSVTTVLVWHGHGLNGTGRPLARENHGGKGHHTFVTRSAMCDLINAAQADHFIMASCEGGKWLQKWWEYFDANIDHRCVAYGSHSPQLAAMMSENIQQFVLKKSLQGNPFDMRFEATRWGNMMALGLFG